METTKNQKAILTLIKELKQYDNKQGYKLSYKKVKKKLENTTTNLIKHAEAATKYLHPLLEHEETWSCLFALEILKQIKSEKSISPLINFIKNNEHGDYWESCDTALFALIAIGEPAIKPLLTKIKSNFKNKIYYGFLVNALTGIKNEQVYSFMLETLKDYINNLEKYDEWFEIDNFTYDFNVQGKKEVLPLLKKLLSMEHLSEYEKREINSTIEVIEDPKKFEKETKEMAEAFKEYNNIKKEDIDENKSIEKAINLEEQKDYNDALELVSKVLAAYPKSYHALFLKARINRKLGKPDVISLSESLEQAEKQKADQEFLTLAKEERNKIRDLHTEMESTPDEDFELNFKCSSCNKRQNLKPGLIWEMGDGNKYLFENEIMCKYCFSHNIKLTKHGEMNMFSKKMRLMTGESTGILNVGKEVYVENKKMKFSKSYSYLLHRIKQEPLNGELNLRAGNSARKENKYEDAIKHYEKALNLNPKLIAVYINLVEIYAYRYNYYKIKEAKDKAILHLKKLKELYETNDYDITTLHNPSTIIQFIRENESEFKISSEFKKIKEEDVKDFLKQASTFDMESTLENIKKNTANSKEQAQKLLKENKGILETQSYQIFDKETNKSQILSLSSVVKIDPSKLCICGSGRYLKDCCFKHAIKNKPFVINMDYATYSLFEPIKKKIRTNENFTKLVKGFKEDPRFYCQEETNTTTTFLYYGNAFFSVKNLGNIIFGTIKVKKKFNNKSKIDIEAFSKNRFDSLYPAVKEHIEYA